MTNRIRKDYRIRSYAGDSVKADLKEMIKAPKDVSRKKGLSNSENPNGILTSKGWDYIFNTVEEDTHYSSVLATRANDLVSRGFRVLPAFSRVDGKSVITPRDREIAEFVRYALDGMSRTIERDIIAMMTHISRGFSITEINWAPLKFGPFAGKIGLRDLRFKRQDIFSFAFDDYGRFDICTVNPDKGVIDKNKVIHLVSGFDDENPYGESVAARCAFWVWMKQNGVKYWAIHQERFGSPLTSLEVPDNIRSNAQLQKIADDVLIAAQEDMAIQVPRGMVLKFIEATRTGDAGYGNFYEITNREMSKAVLGSTLTNDIGKSSTGSHAMAKVHADTTSVYFDFDRISVASELNNQLIKRLVDINYPSVERYPRLVWEGFDASTFVSAAQGIQSMANTNVKIPVRWVNEIFNIPFPEAEEEVLSILGMSGVVPTEIKGVDNRASSGGYSRSFSGSSVKNHVRANDRYLADQAKSASEKWSDFARKIAARRSFDDADMQSFQTREMFPFYREALILGRLKGIDDAKKEIKDAFSVYEPFDEVIRDYVNRGVITWAEYEELEAFARREAFGIAGVESVALLEKFKARILEVLRGDSAQTDFYAGIMNVFESEGLSPLNWHHIEVVLRNTLNTQYTSGRFKVFDGLDMSDFPFLQIVCIMDTAVRKTHAALHCYTRPLNDPVWKWLRSPFDHNCRCTIRAVHKSENLTASNWIPDRSQYRFLN